ncbi:MAG: hypothetical protein J6J11_03635 [Treponema sp.]|nr:hypothetical protein [Clostridia bacterium]MBP3607389.1 hypothetical protein [Treponema sp.]
MLGFVTGGLSKLLSGLLPQLGSLLSSVLPLLGPALAAARCCRGRICCW